MNPADEMLFLKAGGTALIALAILVVSYWIYTDEDGKLHRAYKNYTINVEKKCRLLYLPQSGRDIARYQFIICIALLLGAAFLEEPILLPAALVTLLAPNMWLNARVSSRRRALEDQLDGFLVTLSNALRASPALGDAMGTTANLMRAPIKQDLDFLLKEHKLGTSLDVALTNMADRVDSRSFNATLLTILVGRQTGGNLPEILDRAAASLREMIRLEGVVRSKTAEGRFQAYVLGAIPFLIIAALRFVDPKWLKPLTDTFSGNILLLVAVALWVGAILLARKILDVDL